MRRFEKEGRGEPSPASGLKRAGYMALTHFWKLITANILFVLFSLPIITMPAALTALDRVCVIIFRDGNIFLWYEFWKEFRRSFVRVLAPGILFGLGLFAGYFFMSLGNGNPERGMITILFWTIGMMMTLTVLLVGEYFFVMVSVLEVSNFDALRNAVLLSLARPVRSAAILLILFLLLFGALALLPLSLILIVFIWAVLAQYPVSCLAYDMIEKMILIPYQNRKEESL